MIVMAGAAGVVSTVSAGIAAVAALVTIIFARQSARASTAAAQAGHEAVQLGKAMRIEEDFRRFGDALLSLWQYAGDAQKNPGSPRAIASVRHAQIRLVATLSPRVRIELPDAAADMLEQALNRDTPPDELYSAASLVLSHFEHAWDAWLARQRDGDLDPKG